MTFAVRGMVLIVICVWVSMAKAQTFEEALIDEYFEALREKPERYLEQAAEVILGYGRDGAIDAAGIETMITIERAAIRALAGRRLLIADLDNDGQVTRAEAGLVMPTLSASLRARLIMLHRQTDSDQDGTVSAKELRADAEAQARRSLTENKAEDYRRLMLMDINADGWLTLDEAQETIEQFREGA